MVSLFSILGLLKLSLIVEHFQILGIWSAVLQLFLLLVAHITPV
jgi:hypothetical protein